MTVGEIRALLREDKADPEVIAALAEDPRKGVQNLLAAYMRRMERANAEMARVEAMYQYESEQYSRNSRTRRRPCGSRRRGPSRGMYLTPMRSCRRS